MGGTPSLTSLADVDTAECETSPGDAAPEPAGKTAWPGEDEEEEEEEDDEDGFGEDGLGEMHGNPCPICLA